jgi:hypothetical protein
MTSTVAHGCYQMVTIATNKDMMSPKTVATEVHSSDGRFGDITDEHCRHGSHVAKVGHLIATEAFCSSECTHIYRCKI